VVEERCTSRPVDVDATGHMHVLADKWAALKEEV